MVGSSVNAPPASGGANSKPVTNTVPKGDGSSPTSFSPTTGGAGLPGSRLNGLSRDTLTLGGGLNNLGSPGPDANALGINAKPGQALPTGMFGWNWRSGNSSAVIGASASPQQN